jgi:hypothetical protein
LLEELDQNTHLEPATFMHDDLQRVSPMPYGDLELLFWRIRHQESGYLLTHALQLVLDALPASTTLRIRTSQGHILHTSVHDFTIAETPIALSETMYICQMTKQPGMSPTQFGITQYLTSAESSVPWSYVLFGGSVAANWDSQVAVDLISPLMGLRGLGGEVFVMEKLVDLQNKVLPAPWDTDQLAVTPRIVPSPLWVQHANESVALSERVLRRLEGGEELFCGYCGKSAPVAQCSGCREPKYCNSECQSMGWTYHRRWCREPL